MLATLSLQQQKIIQAQEYLSFMLGEVLCSIEDYAKYVYLEKLKQENSKSKTTKKETGKKNIDKTQKKELDKIPKLILHYQKYNNFNAGNNMNKMELRNRVILKIRNFKGGIEDYQYVYKQVYNYPEGFNSIDMINIEYYLNILKDDINLVEYIKESFGIKQEENKECSDKFEETCFNEVKMYEKSIGNFPNPSPKIYMKYGPSICNKANEIGKKAIEKYENNPTYKASIDRDKSIKENIYYKDSAIETFDAEINNVDTKNKPSGNHGFFNFLKKIF